MIPKIVFQTSKNKKLYNENKALKYCPNYKYIHFNDNECVQFLKEHFLESHPNIIERFNRLQGAHKADLIRYAFLYINGGVYFDTDIHLTHDINDIIGSYDFVSVFTRKKAIKNYIPMVMNGFIACTSKHPILLEALNNIYQMKLHKITNDFLVICHHFGLIIQKYVQEPLVHNRAIYNKNVKLLEDNHPLFGSYYNITDITLELRVMYHKFDVLKSIPCEKVSDVS